jgi:hypothetical protein
MATNDPASEFSLDNPADVAVLRRSWEAGDLLRYVAPVLDFVVRHRAEILVLTSGATDPAALLASTKRFIMRSRIVHFCFEMKDQQREISREIWYCGERGDYDRARIEQDWTARYAADWRRWRIKEYLFVAERCETEIVALLRA